MMYTIGSYRWGRILLLNGAFSQVLLPTSGIIAGFTSATFEAKAYLMPTVQSWTQEPNSSALGVISHSYPVACERTARALGLHALDQEDEHHRQLQPA
eukprot:6710037-Pyramimonas_sp.AAC.1